MATSELGVPLRKRTRKACDQCRRRKTKCQGDLDCATCIEVGIKCTYGHTVKQRRGLKYVAYLEEKVEDLESRVGTVPAGSKKMDDNGASANHNKSDATSSLGPAVAPSDLAMPTTSWDDTSTKLTPRSSPSLPARIDVLETINCAPKRAFGNMATTHYRGNSSGIEILRHLHSFCYECAQLTIDEQKFAAANLMNALDRSFPLHYLSLNSMTNAFLPSFAKLNYWTEIAFCRAFTLWPFVDRQLFQFNVKRLFEQRSFGGDIADRDHLALIYAVLALGQRYDPENVPMDDSVESGSMTGLNYFAAALDLVPLADCNRSITAVQTVLCLALFLKSISAQGMMHTYVSTAACAAHQLGLHVASPHLAERERVIRHRVYTALKGFDTYVTTSLGLPRNVRTSGPLRETLDAPYIDCREMLTAADAYAELMKILGAAVEASYFTGDTSAVHGPHFVRYECLDEADKSLEEWETRFLVHARTGEHTVPIRTTLQLLLEYSKCFVLLMLYSPFTHHYAKPRDNQNTQASARGFKCIETAIQAVSIADALNNRGLLIEAYPLTVDVLIVAATTLLAVGLAAPDDNIAAAASNASKTAKALLEQLSARNAAIARCLMSLTPLYDSLPERSLTSQAMTAMRDFTLFTTCGDDSNPESELEFSNMGLFVANNFQNSLATSSYVSAEPDWPSENCFASNRGLCY